MAFTNGIAVKIAVAKNCGVEEYHFPAGKKGLLIDLSHTLTNTPNKTFGTANQWITDMNAKVF